MPGVDFLALELRHVARQLKDAGDKDIEREFKDAVTRATRPVADEIRAGLRPRLPDPYAVEFGADLRITVSKRYGKNRPGVTVKAETRSGKRRKLKRLDAGVLAHPLFGNRKRWFNQPVTPGWFTTPAMEAGDRAREEITKAMDRVAIAATRRG